MRKITIIGSGLVGSLWAYLLNKQGYDVTVFEKRSDPRLQTIHAGRSINLILTSRGLHGLEMAGLTRAILPFTVPVYGRRIHQKSHEKIFQPYGRDNTECNYSVSRWDLNKALIEQCLNAGIKIHFDHSIENMDIKNKKITFQNNTETKIIDYDLLFATDGAGSVVRKLLTQQNPTEFTDQTDWLSSGYKELFMPANPEMTLNELHIWARGTHMMMGLENKDKSFTMTLYLPHKNHDYSFENLNTKETVKNLFEKEFSSAVPLMPSYVDDFLNNPVGNLGTVRLNKWIYQNSIALMGDASHAIVPFFGQGMNSGFEDCTTMLQLLQKSKGNWDQTLNDYDEIQRPNAKAIADMALENFVEMRDSVADPQFQFRKKIEAVLEKNFPHLYRSRYGMITYTLIPYRVAQVAGLKQNHLLDLLSKNITQPDQLDLVETEKILKSDFYPWLNQQGYTTDRYTV